MNTAAMVSLVKERLLIKSDVRDSFITAIVSAAVKELEDEKGLVLDDANPQHLLLCCDYSTWLYESREKGGAMPRHLQFRIHNMMIHSGGDFVE
jgi:hypothetical protein